VNGFTNFEADFDRDNFVHWGKLYEAKDVKVDWHGIFEFTSSWTAVLTQ